MNKHFGAIMRLINASKCSLEGIAYALKNEAAFRQEVILCVGLVPLAFYLSSDTIELILLLGSLMLLLCVECINSAIEATVDRISLDYHPLSKHAKDLGSAAVLFSLLITLITWGLIALY